MAPGRLPSRAAGPRRGLRAPRGCGRSPPPPARCWRLRPALSTTVVATPRATSARGQVNPVGPAPTTRTSVSRVFISVSFRLAVMPTLVGITMRPRIRHVNSCWPTLVGMRRSSEETKAVILAAARERFAESGFERATIRAIAADANIDPSMVMRYFGNKDQLFAAAADFDLRFPTCPASIPRSSGPPGRALHGPMGTRRGADRAAAVERDQRRCGATDAPRSSPASCCR